jgi:xylulokinase
MTAYKGQIRVLGVDLGTTALKAVVSDGHRVIASAQAAITTRRPKPLWSEQNPQDWWTALVKACRELSAQHPAEWRRIAAIGLSGHMHGAVLLKDGDPLRPCILHNDGRASAEAAALNAALPGHAAIAGVRAMAGFTAPKLLWLKRHEPDVLAAAEVVMSPKDYLRFRITGLLATDPVDASGMWLLDVGKRQWNEDLISACGLRPSQLPEIREGNAVAGPLTAQAARSLGLSASTLVVTGTGDAAANTLGLGLISEGDGVVSMGTAAQIFVSKSAHVPAPAQNIHAFAHALPGVWFQMAAMLNGASPLAWMAERLNRADDIPALLRAVEKRMTTPSHLLFLPYLAGERTPNDDPAMRAAFLGLDATHDEIDLTRAVMEGVALSLADSYDVLTATGTTPHTLYAVGGGFRSKLWAGMIASALGRPIRLIADSANAGAIGVARLARQAVTGETTAEVFRKPERSTEILPIAAWQDRYAARLPAYRSLYHSLKSIR